MTAESRRALWASAPIFDEQTRGEAEAIAGNEAETLLRFGAELGFGTGGLRGVLGVGSNRMNIYTVARASQGLAEYLKSIRGKNVAIGYDSRLFSREFAFVTAGVMAQNGIHAHVYDTLMPTPMLSYAVRALHCDAGVVITASHNPSEYNGYKVYGPDGCQVGNEAAGEITRRMEEIDYEALKWLSEAEARSAGLLSSIPESVIESYYEATLAMRVKPPKPAASLKVVYTPLNGTGLIPVRAIAEKMGLEPFIVVPEQAEPDGRFPTCPKPNPEIRETLELALALAEKEGAQLLLATDPDCDRVGVAAPDANGAFQVLTGNEVGFLLAEYLLGMRRASGTLPERPVIVKTIVSSDLAFDIAKTYGAEVVEVLTGFKYIGEVVARLEAQGRLDDFILGYEESCGYLSGGQVRDKDGVLAVMLILDMAMHYAGQGRTLLDALATIYETYGYIQNEQLSFDIEGALPQERVSEMMRDLRANPPARLNGAAIVRVTDYLSGVGGLPVSNVVSYINEIGDKAIVRPSGTEPKLKIYLSARGQSRAGVEAEIVSMARETMGWLRL